MSWLLGESDFLLIFCYFSQLHSDRDSIPDVPAIYFCAPSEENLGRIAQDFQNGLYDVYHLNFISPISRQKLEDLAAGALQSSCVANIHKVYDQYLNFITLEDDFFILKHQNSDSMSYYGEDSIRFRLNLLKLNFNFQPSTERTPTTSRWNR